MNESNRERVNDFLRDLEEALGRSGRQSEEIAEEVRADLEAHMERLQGEGRSESEAVELALRDLGNPYPTEEEFKSERSKLASKGVSYWKDENGFVFFWRRPLSSGFSIVYTSQEDRASIQD